MPPLNDTPKRKRVPPSLESQSLPPPILPPPILPRKRPGVEVQIPPTPPTSSPPTQEDMPYTTNINGVQVLTQEDGTGSPRTRVAYHFQGLRLEEGGDVSNLSLDTQHPKGSDHLPGFHSQIGGDDMDESIVRKRMRFLGNEPSNGKSAAGKLEIPETPIGNTKKFGISIGPERTIDPFLGEIAKKVVLQNEIDPVIFRGSAVAKAKGAGLARAYPSINRLADSKSRAKSKRAGTPPLFGSADASVEQSEVVDLERAGMTWQQDEITGHNPTDPEDDGEGINGIGFRPTPAEAYTRAQKRKQQMADYKSREAKEARAKRNEKRRGIESGNREEKEAERRVRFLESDKASLVTIG